jgi:FkbM family methyltransferase
MVLHLLELADGFSCYVSGGANGEFEGRGVYQEIFQGRCYDGPELSEAPFIIDAGGHIGLFSLYMKQKYPRSKIIAFEPAPETFDALSRNLERHNVSDVVTYPYGLASKSGTEILTYYPVSHANTTFVPQEKELQKKMFADAVGQDFMHTMYEAMEIPVPVNRLSHFLSNHHVDVRQIDLLKVDVEGMELEVLGGLDDAHWALVRNVVMEVSDLYGLLSKIEHLLRSKGFMVTSIPQGPAEELKMYFVTARRYC